MSKTIFSALCLFLISTIPTAAQSKTEISNVEVNLSIDDIMGILRIANVACKATGLDDGGNVCSFAQTVSKKLSEAAKKPSEPK